MTHILKPSILVVEDEPLILIEALDMVEDEGFQAYEASNADEALALLELYPHIAVLLTDIDMPGSMDGLMLAQRVRKQWPHMAIVVVSGHQRPTQGELPKDGRFLPKPYVRAAIMKALRETMAG